MKIYISCDMEGASGICRGEQVTKSSPAYQNEGRKYLCADVNAAVAGAIDGGATEIVVSDAHGDGYNFILEMMDARVSLYETTRPGGVRMPALDETFDGMILLAYHAMAGTQNGFLDHTMMSTCVYNYFINGRRVGEIGIDTAWAGHYDVPLIMVSSDAAGCEEAASAFPGIETAVVKWALCRSTARCLPLPQAHECIRRAAAEAVKRCRKLKPWKLDLPIELVYQLYRADYVDSLAAQRGVERIDARSVRRVVHSALDVWPW